MKGQDQTPEKQLNKVETGNIPENEFRIMIVKMIQGLVKTMEKMQEMFTKDLQNQPQTIKKQHARPPCPSPTPRVHSNSLP